MPDAAINAVKQLFLQARTSLSAYSVAQRPNLTLGPHHYRLIEVLEKVERGEITRLMVFMPPQFGKSTFATKLFPAWFIGKHPDWYAIISSYAAELAEDFGAEVKELCETDVHKALFPACRIRGDSKAKHDFGLSAGGACRAVGRGGSITGRPAHLIILDDPEKDRQEADSEAVQKELRAWFNGTIYARARPFTRLVLIKTRWSPDDIAGWELEEHGKLENWTILSLPALGRDDEQGVRVPDETDKGVSLWPEMYPTDYLRKVRDRSTLSEWLALYQQVPTKFGDTQTFNPEWVQRFDNDVTFRAHLKKMHVYILGDPANAKNKKSDFTFIWIVGLNSDGNYYFFDAVRDKLNQAERWEALYQKHKFWSEYCRVKAVGWEAYGLQTDVGFFQEKMKQVNYRFAITPVGGNTKKEDRIKGSLGIYSEKRFYLAREIAGITQGRPTNIAEDFLKTEYERFPAVRHDDGLDCAARIKSPELHVAFPTKNQDQTDDIYRQRSERRRDTGWMAW